ncbi:hypothetical protein [Prauserella endophytica]|nr:hypothetical protein [Prauserella endophytica]
MTGWFWEMALRGVGGAITVMLWVQLRFREHITHHEEPNRAPAAAPDPR